MTSIVEYFRSMLQEKPRVHIISSHQDLFNFHYLVARLDRASIKYGRQEEILKPVSNHVETRKQAKIPIFPFAAALFGNNEKNYRIEVVTAPQKEM